MIGKTVGELSPFKDIESNKVMLDRLQKDGYVRYDHLPRETPDLHEFYKNGANAYVVKPVDFSEFTNAVQQLGIFWAAVNEPPPNAGSEPTSIQK